MIYCQFRWNSYILDIKTNIIRQGMRISLINVLALFLRGSVINLYVFQNEDIYWDARSWLLFLDKKFGM